METRKLASIFVSFLNAVIATCEEAVEMTEKELAKGGDDNAESSRQRKANNDKTRSSKKDDDDDDDDDKGKTSSRRSSKKDDDDDDDDKGKDDEPELEDLQDAVRAALKVCEKADVVKCLKKHGKAEKASDVEPENRQAAIDALEKMVDEA